MFSNKFLAGAIIVICFLSLVLGVFDNLKPDKNTFGKETISEESSEQMGSTGFAPYKNKIALIVVNGVISADTGGGFELNDYSATNALKALKAIQKDKTVKGVLIKVNSPGGTVAQSQNLYDAVMRVRKEKPVVVAMEDVAASGGYYLASAADRIFAQSGTLTGSIGVIFSTVDVHKLLTDKLSITQNTIKSGKYKDLGSEFRAMTDDERKLLQDIVNDSYSEFVSAIENGRVKRTDKYSSPKKNLDSQTLKKYADGRIFTGKQAQKLGFVDEIGDSQAATDTLQKMAKERFNLSGKELSVVSYNKPPNLNELFFGSMQSAFDKNVWIKTLLPASVRYSRQPLYLWE